MGPVAASHDRRSWGNPDEERDCQSRWRWQADVVPRQCGAEEPERPRPGAIPAHIPLASPLALAPQVAKLP